MTQDTPAALPDPSFERMFNAAILDLAAINEALDLDPDDGGAAPILEAIASLKAQAATSAAGGATGDLPPLPPHRFCLNSNPMVEGYTAEEMREYARAALAAQSPDSGAGPGEPTIYLRADGPHEEAKGTACPVTGRPYFMHLTHPELGQVPTYGGPYDSYTAPYAEGDPLDPWHERELTVHRYDHDRGHWVEDEGIPLRIIHEEVLFKLEEDAARAKPAALAQQGAQNG